MLVFKKILSAIQRLETFEWQAMPHTSLQINNGVEKHTHCAYDRKRANVYSMQRTITNWGGNPSPHTHNPQWADYVPLIKEQIQDAKNICKDAQTF